MPCRGRIGFIQHTQLFVEIISKQVKMKTLKYICVVFFILSHFTGSILSTEPSITLKEAEEEDYDHKLSEFMREVLENFRDQMPGGIPPIDPLIIPDVVEDIEDGIAKVDLRMRRINVTGLSAFELRSLKADLERGFVNFSIALPEMEADGYCYMDGKVLGIFPVNSDGPFYIRVAEVSIDGYGNLTVNTEGETKVHMNDLRLALTFGPLKIQFESLLGGGKWTQVLIRILTGLGRNLFTRFNKEIMTKVNGALLKLINKELDKGTLKDLLDLIPS